MNKSNYRPDSVADADTKSSKVDDSKTPNIHITSILIPSYGICSGWY